MSLSLLAYVNLVRETEEGAREGGWRNRWSFTKSLSDGQKGEGIEKGGGNEEMGAEGI